MPPRTMQSALDQIERQLDYIAELKTRIAELEVWQMAHTVDGAWIQECRWAEDELLTIYEDSPFVYAIFCKRRTEDKTHDTSDGSRVPSTAEPQP